MGTSFSLIDVATLQFCDISSSAYWRQPFESLAGVADLVEFTILDIEPDYSKSKGKYVMADAQVALAGAFRSSGGIPEDEMMDYDSIGQATSIFHTRTHLGAILQPGDTALGYHLTNSNYNSTDFSSLPSHFIPDIILVKKAYPNRRKKSRSRNWKLRSIAKEPGEEGETGSGRGVVGRLGGRDQKKVDEDYELFLRELEEDPEMRAGVNMYKAKKDTEDEEERKDARMVGPGTEGPAHGGSKRRGGGGGGGKKDKGRTSVDVNMGEAEQDRHHHDEPDFPEVQLDELLEDFDEMTLGNDEVEEEDQ
jgi:nonsense-mediated mRNA decay protein 3